MQWNCLKSQIVCGKYRMCCILFSPSTVGLLHVKLVSSRTSCDSHHVQGSSRTDTLCIENSYYESMFFLMLHMILYFNIFCTSRRHNTNPVTQYNWHILTIILWIASCCFCCCSNFVYLYPQDARVRCPSSYQQCGIFNDLTSFSQYFFTNKWKYFKIILK